MSGHQHAVSQETRERVLKVVATLRYEPNSAAKNLRTLRSGKLLVMVPDISNPFFSLVLQGIEEAATREGYAVLLGDTQHDPKREERYALMLKKKEADGLIFLGHRVPNEVARLVKESLPKCAPVVNGCEFTPSIGVPSVHIDNAGAAYEAMDHLYGLGHRRIGIVTGPLISPLSQDRLNGTMRRAKEAGLQSALTVLTGEFTVESGAEAAIQLLDKSDPPTALFCFSDEMAIGAMDVVRRRGLSVPADLSVVGFDDIRFARYVNPPLTTVAQPMREIGEGCVRLLLEILRGHTIAPVSLTLPHQFIVRSTTGTPKQ
jgi:LacI family repressor for deo operon, udp, cdd, tsx, nupC, and nupG